MHRLLHALEAGRRRRVLPRREVPHAVLELHLVVGVVAHARAAAALPLRVRLVADVHGVRLLLQHVLGRVRAVAAAAAEARARRRADAQAVRVLVDHHHVAVDLDDRGPRAAQVGAAGEAAEHALGAAVVGDALELLAILDRPGHGVAGTARAGGRASEKLRTCSVVFCVRAQ